MIYQYRIVCVCALVCGSGGGKGEGVIHTYEVELLF